MMISLDAVDDADVDFLGTMPHFAGLCRAGTLVRRPESVFVSNTYPAHSSIITGDYPARHGLTENVRTQPGNPHPDWRCDAAELKVPTLYGKAAKAGLSVMSVLYPVTCGSGIRWNIPEVPGWMPLARRAVKMLGGGTPGFIFSAYFHDAGYLSRPDEPQLDNFTSHAAARALREKRPDLLLLHLIDTDRHKHIYGPRSAEAKESLRRHDGRLGLLLEAARETWPEEERAVIVFSDHGCLPVRQAVDPNDHLRRAGLIRQPARLAKDFDAFFHNAGGCTFLKIYRPERTDAALAVAAELLRGPASRMLTGEEMRLSGMDSQFLCGLEAADGVCFGKGHRGQHGYALHHPGYYPFYLAAGPGVARGRVQTGGCIIDICPLAAHLLGIPLWDMDGTDRVTDGPA